MAMVALAVGGDTISTQARRDAIIDGLFDLPSKFLANGCFIVSLENTHFSRPGEESFNCNIVFLHFCRQSQGGPEA